MTVLDVPPTAAGARSVLSAAELEALVREIAADPARWREHVRHDPVQRHFACVRRDPGVEVWVVSWMDGHDTGFHDHEDSGAAIVVAEGEIRELRLRVGADALDRRFGTGAALTVPPAAIHRVRHAGTHPAVTIHAYSPPLARMGTYEVSDSGELLRFAQAADEELKAVA